ncbi:RadC family protein [Ideonella margarita]|uniref:DNA repair protein RadC n=1 Tax=Ideonella margarita TaxID=2984191 RepID=A0ABU9C2X2_9BURK
MSLKDLPAALRPREKLLTHGPAALADAELLALLLRTGMKGKGVLALADELLTRFHGYAGLLHRQADDFRQIKGLGPAKRAELAAVIEMARRALAQQLERGPVFDSPARVKEFVALRLGGQQREVFGVIYLDSQHRMLEWCELFHGTLTQTSVYPREVVRQAMALNAGAVILAHNHPSGLAEPSRADEHLTQALKGALAMVDVRVLDHLVVGAGCVVSLAERGLM